MGGAAIGLVATTGAASLLSCSPKVKAAPGVPWPYKPLDPVAVAERAYAAYSEGGCMYGAFEGLIGELREKIGAPYDSFPAVMMKYGAAGVVGWGTLCGSLNGAAAAIYLLAEEKVAKSIINEVFGWYGTQALPTYQPKQPKFPQIPTSVANSQLCHVSVTTWSKTSGFKTGSPERAERCAWVTASVAKYVAELLNQQSNGTFKPAFAVSSDVSDCLSCHGKGGSVENVHTSNQTSCTVCHTDIGKGHPNQ